MNKDPNYNYKQVIQRSPNANKSYFCEVCGQKNDPFAASGDGYKELLKKNICKRCAELKKKQTLFDKRTGD